MASDAFHIYSEQPEGLPDGAKCLHEVMKTRDGLLLAASSIATSRDAEFATTSDVGLSIGIVRGRMRFDLAGNRKAPFDGPFGYYLATPEPLVTNHYMKADDRVKGLFLHVPNAALDALDLRNDVMAGKSRRASPQGTDFQTWRPDAAIVHIANEIVGCSYTGALRTVFLEAKSLELLARVLAPASASQQQGGSNDPVLSRREIERFMHARDILVGSLASPPTLSQLARQVGVSTSGLTAGFRKVFSTSVVEFIQRERLAQAEMMLSEGQSVAQAAYRVGYSPAHFSTLFRRHFGYPPSALTGKRS